MLSRILAGRRSKWAMIVLWLVVAVLLVPLSGMLKSVKNNDPINNLPKAAQSAQVEHLLANLPGGNKADAVVVYARPGGLSGADRVRITAARAEVAAKVSTTGPVGPVVDAGDHAAALFTVPLANSIKNLPTPVADIRRLVGGPGGGLQEAVTGAAAFSVDSSNEFKGVDTTLLLAAGVVVALLLLLIYRSPLLWLIPITSAGLAVVVAQAAVYELARHAGLTVTGVSSGILDVLVFGAGTDYALLLISRYREELCRHEDRHQAMALALRRALPAIVASAATVVLGLLCLLVATVNSDRSLGPVLAVGVVASLIAALTIIPALLLVCGRRVFWPLVPRADNDERHRAGLWARVGARVGRRPRAVWVATVLVLGIGAVGLSGLQLGLPKGHSFIGTVGAVQGQNLLDAHFPAGSGSPATVITSSTTVTQVERVAAQTPGVSGVRATAAAGGLSELSVTLTSPPDSQAASPTVTQLRDHVGAVSGSKAIVGGPTAIALDTNQAAAHDRKLIFPLVMVIVLVILGLLLRSAVAPVVLGATVVLSFAASLGVSGLIFRFGLHFAGTDQGVPLYAFIFLVALGVDYNIFLMSRIREEAIRWGTSEGTLRGLAVTGGVITSAGVVVAATFAVLAILPAVVLVEVGFTVAFGILLDTLIVRSILVPALSLDLGHRMWGPSRVGKSPSELIAPNGVDTESTQVEEKTGL